MAIEHTERPEDENDNERLDHPGGSSGADDAKPDDMFLVDLEQDADEDFAAAEDEGSEIELSLTQGMQDEAETSADWGVSDATFENGDDLEFVLEIEGEEGSADADLSAELALFSDLEEDSQRIVDETQDLGPGLESEVEDEALHVTSDDLVLVDESGATQETVAESTAPEAAELLEPEAATSDSWLVGVDADEPKSAAPTTGAARVQGDPLRYGEVSLRAPEDVAAEAEPVLEEPEEAPAFPFGLAGDEGAEDSPGLEVAGELAQSTAPDFVAESFAVDAEAVEEAAEEEFDPIYGSRGDEEYAVVDDRAEEPDFRALEPMLQDAEMPVVPQVVGGAPVRRAWTRHLMAASMAACVLVLGLVAFVSLRPDLPLAQRIRGVLGMSTSMRPAIEVAVVQRPSVTTELPVPGVEVPPELKVADVPPVVPPVGPPDQPGPPVVVTPPSLPRVGTTVGRVLGSIAWLGDRAGRVATTLNPFRGRSRAAMPSDPIVSRPPDTPTPVDVPERVATTQPVAPIARRYQSMTELGNGVVLGVQAFAQLHNGHFFVGRVRKIVPDELVISVEQGELTFVPGELQKLLPLAEAEARILHSGPDGYVRLKNRYQIWGKILEDLPDVITIQTTEARIVVPRETVAEVSKKPAPGVQLGQDEREWDLDPEHAAEAPPLPVPERETGKEAATGNVRVQLGPTPRDDSKPDAPQQVPAVPDRR